MRGTEVGGDDLDYANISGLHLTSPNPGEEFLCFFGLGSDTFVGRGFSPWAKGSERESVGRLVGWDLAGIINGLLLTSLGYRNRGWR